MAKYMKVNAFLCKIHNLPVLAADALNFKLNGVLCMFDITCVQFVLVLVSPDQICCTRSCNDVIPVEV